MRVAVSGPVLLLPWLAAVLGWPSKHRRPCSRPAHRPASRHRCGAVQGCIGQAMFATYLWRMGKPRLLSAGPAPQHGATADAQLALLWMILVRPAGSARARARARAPRSPCEPGAASCFGQAVARPLVSRKDGHECRARLLCKGGSAWGARCFLLQAAGDPNLMTRRHGSAPGAWRGRAGDAAAVRGDRRGDRLQDDQQQPVAQGCAARLRRCVSVTRTSSGLAGWALAVHKHARRWRTGAAPAPVQTREQRAWRRALVLCGKLAVCTAPQRLGGDEP